MYKSILYAMCLLSVQYGHSYAVIFNNQLNEDIGDADFFYRTNTHPADIELTPQLVPPQSSVNISIAALIEDIQHNEIGQTDARVNLTFRAWSFAFPNRIDCTPSLYITKDTNYNNLDRLVSVALSQVGQGGNVQYRCNVNIPSNK